MNKRLSDDQSNASHGSSLAEGPREFLHDPKSRFAPADNLYDAIRSDVAGLAGYEFRPLERHYNRDLPFVNDPAFYDQE